MNTASTDKSAPRFPHWSALALWREGDDGVNRRINDQQQRAKALISFRDNRRFPEGVFPFGVKVVFDETEVTGQHTFVHAYTLTAYVFDSDRQEFVAMFDIRERAAFSEKLKQGIWPRGVQPWNKEIDWNGIEDAASKGTIGDAVSRKGVVRF